MHMHKAYADAALLIGSSLGYHRLLSYNNRVISYYIHVVSYYYVIFIFIIV